MATIVKAVADATGPEFQIGVQIMVNALKASVAVAKVCGGSFLRCTALVEATVSAAGMIEAKRHDFLTYRAQIGAQQIKLIAEANSRHFRWLGDTPTADVARMAMRVGAAAVEVAHPDEQTNASLVRDIKRAMPHLPVILGGTRRTRMSPGGSPRRMVFLWGPASRPTAGMVEWTSSVCAPMSISLRTWGN
jgi:predicted TIM-barrel enzyme